MESVIKHVEGFYSDEDVEILIEAILRSKGKEDENAKYNGDYIRVDENNYILKCSSLSDEGALADRKGQVVLVGWTDMQQS